MNGLDCVLWAGVVRRISNWFCLQSDPVILISNTNYCRLLTIGSKSAVWESAVQLNLFLSVQVFYSEKNRTTDSYFYSLRPTTQNTLLLCSGCKDTLVQLFCILALFISDIWLWSCSEAEYQCFYTKLTWQKTICHFYFVKKRFVLYFKLSGTSWVTVRVFRTKDHIWSQSLFSDQLQPKDFQVYGSCFDPVCLHYSLYLSCGSETCPVRCCGHQETNCVPVRDPLLQPVSL